MGGGEGCATKRAKLRIILMRNLKEGTGNKNGYLGHIFTVMLKKETNAAGKASFACVSVYVSVENMTCMASHTHTHTQRLLNAGSRRGANLQREGDRCKALLYTVS